MDYAECMIRAPALFLSIWLSAMLPAIAQEAASRPVLVELFASQNCPACPQAHRTMREVDESRDDVLILTWTVDYWDYLGAEDPMAIPEAKARQADYADWLGLRAPYTPQSIYNGVKECPGPRKKQVLSNIDLLAARDGASQVLREADGRMTAEAAEAGAYELFTVHYAGRGTHSTGMVNPVLSLTRLTGLSGVEHGCQRDCVVLLQSTRDGEVAAFWRPSA